MMTTIFLQNIHTIEEVFNFLSPKEYRFWFLYKKGGIRLRIEEELKDTVMGICTAHNFECFEELYECEKFIFGGEDIICWVHFLLIEFTILLYENKDLLASELLLKYSLICQLLDCFEWDYFERWDVWKQLQYYRGLKKQQDVFKLISSFYDLQSKYHIQKFKYIDNMKEVIRDFKTIEPKYRNLRKISANLLIFYMNMLGLKINEQVALINSMAVLTHPDFYSVFFKGEE